MDDFTWQLHGTSRKQGAVPGAASSFTPASLTGLVLWASADTGVTTSGGFVTAQSDRSGHGYDLIGGSAGGPNLTFDNTFMNGRPAFTILQNFNSGLMYRIGQTIDMGSANPGAWSVFFVITIKSTIGDGAGLFGMTGNGADYAYSGGANDYGTNWVAASQALQSPYLSGAPLSGTIPLDTPIRLGLINDGVNVQWYVNNVASGAAGTSQGRANSPTSNVGILCWVGAGNPASPAAFFCGYSDFVLTKNALNSTDRTNLDNYFKATWNF